MLREGERVIGRAGSRIGLTSETVRHSCATSVLNAAGPWAAHCAADARRARAPRPAPLLSRAMNLVTRRVLVTHACGGLAGGRFLFLVPWRHVSIVGTSHDATTAAADALTVTRWDLEAFLADDPRGLSARQPSRRATCAWCIAACCRWSPGKASDVRLLRESAVVDHSSDARRGPDLDVWRALHDRTAHRRGARWTRSFAQRASRRRRPCRTDQTPVARRAPSTNKERLPARRAAARRAEASRPRCSAALHVTYGTQVRRGAADAA